MKIKNSSNVFSIPIILLGIYLLLIIEKPWESIKLLKDIPIQLPYALFMFITILFYGKMRLVSASTNKWVFSLLLLHIILIPFSFNSLFAYQQTYEFSKNVLLYVLLLSLSEDEKSSRLLVKFFVFSISIYMLHSFWEYLHGRYEYRMGITRMIGVDLTDGDPNAFGATVVLSLPFVYALFRTEINSIYRKLYIGHAFLALLCVILTGSRTTFVGLAFLTIFLGCLQKGAKKVTAIMIVLVSILAVWTFMPDEKRNRVRTLWDENSGPANAYGSAKGRYYGWQVSWEMFKENPLTGVGPGGNNFIGYRIAYNLDSLIDRPPTPLQSHILYGEVLAELGLFGALFFVGLIASTFNNCFMALKKIRISKLLDRSGFKCFLSQAIISTLLLLLLFGIGGHNFYRPIWLWLAAWSSMLFRFTGNEAMEL